MGKRTEASIEIGSERFIHKIPQIRNRLIQTTWLKKLSKSEALLTKEFEADIRNLEEGNRNLRALIEPGMQEKAFPEMAVNLESKNDALYRYISSLSTIVSGEIAKAPEIDPSATLSFFKERLGTKIDFMAIRREMLEAIRLANAKLLEGADQFCKKYGVSDQGQLAILIPQVLYACKKCYSIKRANEISVQCKACKSDQWESLPLSMLAEPMQHFIQSNVWLEYGVSRLLRKTPIFKDCCEGHIWLGKSGIEHEIDVFLITKSGKVGLVECTRSFVGLNEMMVFKGKRDDLRADFVLIFSMSGIEPDAVKFGRKYQMYSFERILEVDGLKEEVNRTLEVIG